MTMTVEAGITVGRLQERAAQAGQWLPIDPPHPAQCSVGALIAGNRSGSRRCGYGTIREHLIGLGVVLADGRLIRSGGRVVKNVAGYDLQKLFVGSRGSLGVIVEATFKLLPLPESEQLVQARCGSLVEAGALIEQLVGARLAPVIFDLHHATLNGSGPAPTLVVGFAGTREHVDHQIDRARQLGVASALEVEPQRQFWAEPAPARMRSVLPARTVATLSEMRDAT
jgi:FAD/FMN-containing dehydrogenase